MATMRDLLVRFRGDTKSLQSASQKAKKSIQGVSATAAAAGATVSKSFKLMYASFAPLLAAFGAFEAIRIADQFSLLRARIENATDTTSEFEKAFSGLQKIAAKTGASLDSSVEVFQRLSFVRNELNATVDDMLVFTDSVQKLGVVSGAGPAAMNAALVQLGQGLGEGIFRAEEFNSVLANTPKIVQAIANGLGLDGVSAVRKLVIEGKLLSSDVFDAILSQTETINTQFENFPKTAGRALNLLGLEMLNFVGNLNEATGATKALVFGLERLGDVARVWGSVFKGINNQIAKNVVDARALFADGIYKEALLEERDSLSGFFKTIQESNAEVAQGAKRQVEAIKLKTSATKEATKALEEQRKKNIQLKNEMADLFIRGAQGWDELRQVGIRALQEIGQQMLVQAMGGEASSNLFGSVAQSLMGGISGLFGGSSVPVPAHKPSFASGGSFQVRGRSGIDRNTLSLNGQPISNVAKGETIAVGRAGGGGETVINQNINVSTGVQQTVRAEIMRMLPVINQASVGAVQEARMRGKT